MPIIMQLEHAIHVQSSVELGNPIKQSSLVG